MNASKENAAMAAKALNMLLSKATSDPGAAGRFIAEFLEAAKKKLPTEDAFERQRIKRLTAKARH